MICPPFTALRTVVEARRAARPCAVAAQNMHEEDCGRVHRRGVGADAARAGRVAASCSATPSGAQLFGETDAALARKVPAALAAGLLPILCVGETEEEREAGETQRKLRQQVQIDLAAVADGRAARGGDRLRADLGDRHRQDGDARAGAGGDRVRARAGAATATAAPRSACGSSTAAA